MTPQFQKHPKHIPERGMYGDCFTAALASILDLPIDQVPHFSKLYPKDDKKRQNAIEDFLFKKGYYLILLDYLSGIREIEKISPAHSGGYYHLILGLDHDDDGHACVGFNGKLVHDPHPSQRWLANPKSEWKLGLFIATLNKKTHKNSGLLG
jgi:hypothetical protein